MAQQIPCSPLQWDEQFQYLIKQISNDIHLAQGAQKTRLARYQTAIAIGGYIGPRAKELLHFSWHDLLSGKNKKLYEFKTEKNRVVAFNDKLLRIVEVNFKIVDPMNVHDFILPASDPGKPMTTRGFNKGFGRLLDTYGIKTENASSHTLRKTFAYRVFEQKGKDENALIFVSNLLNHTSIADTRRYLGITRREIAQAYLSLD